MHVSLHVSTVILSIVYRLEIFTGKAFFNTATPLPAPMDIYEGEAGVKIRNAGN